MHRELYFNTIKNGKMVNNSICYNSSKNANILYMLNITQYVSYWPFSKQIDN